ncbi:MAG TPA: VWA domain-containing protein [Bryobacteraceae bacterium]|nr:VWA domain-containing protein [Bryobacteraceae bacterium]
MLRCAITVLAGLAISTGVAQQYQPPGDSQVVLRSTSQEVLLDFIARDKHQKLVTDLRAGDIEVLEDGVPQTLRSFEYHGARDDAVRQNEPIAPRNAAPQTLHEINLVSLVFEGVGAENRREATQAAKDFLANEVEPNTYVGVFTLNHRLALLQQYTNDGGLLNKAVNRALTGAYQQFAKDTEAEVMKLNELQGGPPLRPGSAEERGPGGQDRFTSAERAMVELTLTILTNQFGNLSMDALQRLIEAQATLPGRKSVIYFSPGLMVPPEQPERFRAVISAANRANITFYTVDPTGLDTKSSVRESGILQGAIDNVDGSPGAKQTNFSENLRTLAVDTGGFAISNTNDARLPLRHVMEEVRAHYEATYAPTSTNYDGHFRTIEVRSRRPGIHVQARKGYFALPLVAGTSLAPFESDALAALARQPAPHAFDFHAGVLTFRSGAQSTDCRAVFSVPSQALHFTENRQGKTFRIHVAFLALVKDEQDQVVRKISRDVVFQAPAERRAEFEPGEVTVTLPLALPPGRYHVEAVANDVDGAAASTRKVALVVPDAGVLSDLVLVRSQQPVEERDVTDPLEFAGGKITPEIKATVSQKSGGAEGVYFVLYPGANANPDVRIAVTHDGKVVSAARLSLPPTEADGSLRVLSRIPFSGFDPGIYEVTVTAVQGGATARRTTVFEVE